MPFLLFKFFEVNFHILAKAFNIFLIAVIDSNYFVTRNDYFAESIKVITEHISCSHPYFQFNHLIRTACYPRFFSSYQLLDILVSNNNIFFLLKCFTSLLMILLFLLWSAGNVSNRVFMTFPIA